MDFTLTDSDDGNSLLLDIAIFKYDQLANIDCCRCENLIVFLYHISFCHTAVIPGTGVRGLTRGLANGHQGNQEPLMVKDKVGRLQVSLG